MLDDRKIVLRLLLVFSFLTSLMSLFSPMPLLCLPALIVLYSIFYLFWRSNLYKGILLALCYQWAQVSVAVIVGTYTMTHIRDSLRFSGNIVEAYLLSCMVLFLLSLTIFFCIKKLNFTEDDVEEELGKYNIKKVIAGYIVLIFVLSASDIVWRYIPGLRQLAGVLTYYKWAWFFVMIYMSSKTKDFRKVVYSIVFYEFVYSFYSYFSSFKMVIIFLVMTTLCYTSVKSKNILKYFMVFVLVFYFGTVWVSIKADYRHYLNQGLKQQVVVVTSTEAFNFLGVLVKKNVEPGMDSLWTLVRRLSYIDFFSSTMSYVPSVVPHENGNLTFKTIMHILMPRLLFPDKEVLDDSKDLMKYTGGSYAGLDEGSSSGLGYATYLYIDYGSFLMMFAVIVLGLLHGTIYKIVYRTCPNQLWGWAILNSAFLNLYLYETSLIKKVGSLVVFGLVVSLINMFIMPLLLRKITPVVTKNASPPRGQALS